jgi:hypothetical protein
MFDLLQLNMIYRMLCSSVDSRRRGRLQSTGLVLNNGYDVRLGYIDPQRLAVRGSGIEQALRPSAEALGLGLGLGGPWVAQGPPKRDARETQGSIPRKCFVCNKSWKKAGWG